MTSRSQDLLRDLQSAAPALPTERLLEDASQWDALSRTAGVVRTTAAVGTPDEALAPRRGRRLTSVIVAGGLTASCLATAHGISASPASAMPTADTQLFSLTNQDRAANGVHPLLWHSGLNAVAENWNYTGCGFAIAGRAQDMINRDYFNHPMLGCGGQNVFSMFNGAGIRYGWAGENIAWNNYADQGQSVVQADQQFMNSPEHRANILNGNYTHIGTGSARTAGGQTYQGATNASVYTQEFIQTTVPLPAMYPAPIAVTSPAVSALPSTSSSYFVVSWGGSTLPSPTYRMWVYDAGSWMLYATTGATAVGFVGTPGHSYGFAVEVVGQGYDSGTPSAASMRTSIPANAPRATAFKGLYSVDAYGGLHGGSSAPLPISAYWGGWSIARGMAMRNDGQGGYVLDGFGGLHQFGNAAPTSVSAYWSGWDIARGVALRADGHSGYVLDGYGGVHPFGGAPGVAITGYFPGFDIARSIVLRPDGVSGYVLDGWGGIHPFGGAPGVNGSGYWPGWDIAHSITLRPDGVSGYVMDGWGALHPFGGAPGVGVTGYWPGYDVARSVMMMAGSSTAGWTVDSWGNFWPFGGAPRADDPNPMPNMIRGGGSS